MKKIEFEFPGCDTPRNLFDEPIIDPQALPGSLGRGLNWKRSNFLESVVGSTIHWAGDFEAVIKDQKVLSCKPSTLVFEQGSWHHTQGQITLAEFVFATKWVLDAKELKNVGFGNKARRIGFPVTIFSPQDTRQDVIIELQDLEREGGHYLPWQMGSHMNSEWIVYRKKT